MPASFRNSLTFSLRRWGFGQIKIQTPGSSLYTTRRIWRHLCQQDTILCSKCETVRCRKIRAAQMIKRRRSTSVLTRPHFLYYILFQEYSVNSCMYLIFVVPCIMLYIGEISPTRCNNCVFYSQWLYSTCFGWQSHPSSGVQCCIWPQVSWLA